jgi:hypothetical protein
MQLLPGNDPDEEDDGDEEDDSAVEQVEVATPLVL